MAIPPSANSGAENFSRSNLEFVISILQTKNPSCSKDALRREPCASGAERLEISHWA